MGLLDRLSTSGVPFAAVVLSSLVAYAWVVLLTRVAGPRSLATMSSFDVAATVAMGSTLASTALASVPLVHGLTVLVLLFGLQATIGVLRRRGLLAGLVDNEPLLLLRDGELLPAALAQARISHEEVLAQLRQAGVRRVQDVTAVVLETSGQMSVLHGEVDQVLLQGVRDVRDSRS